MHRELFAKERKEICPEQRLEEKRFIVFCTRVHQGRKGERSSIKMSVRGEDASGGERGGRWACSTFSADMVREKAVSHAV